MYDAVAAIWHKNPQARVLAGAFNVVSVVNKYGSPAYNDPEFLAVVGPNGGTGNPLRTLIYASKQGNTEAAFKDGTSKTILLSEIVGVDSGVDFRGAWTAGAMGASVFSAALVPNANLPDMIGACDNLANTSVYPCLPERVDGRKQVAAARSAHTGGVVCSMADGSTRFVTEGVAPEVWKALATRAGGQGEPDVDQQ
jgi:hypothetical protein